MNNKKLEEIQNSIIEKETNAEKMDDFLKDERLFYSNFKLIYLIQALKKKFM